jgi:GT2 family glycosyltransferase/MoaA/NifB/PqqE/SkfB family radical SAM enzyme
MKKDIAGASVALPEAQKETSYAALKAENIVKGALKILVDPSIPTMPQWVNFQTTFACNLRCPHCQTHGTEALVRQWNRHDMNMPRALLDKGAVEALPYVKTFSLTLNGEPLATPDLFNVLHFCQTFQARLDLITNGGLLSPKMIAKMVPYLGSIGFSIDGGTEKVCEALRLGIQFPKLLHNIRLLTRTFEIMDGRSSIDMCIAMTVMGSNVREMPEMVKLARAVHIPRVEGFPLIVFQANKTEPDDLLKHKSQYNHYRQAAAELAGRLGVNFVFPPPFPADGDEDLPIGSAGMLIPPLPDDYYDHVRAVESYLDDGAIEIEARQIVAEIQSDMEASRAMSAANQAAAESFPPEWESYRTRLAALAQDPNKKTLYCEFLHRRAYIGHDGAIAPCCVPGRPVLGNLNDQTLSEIWNGDPYQEFRRAFFSEQPAPCCQSCSYRTTIPASQLLSGIQLAAPKPLKAVSQPALPGAAANPPTQQLVSVCIPAYNGEKYLAESIQSVLDQTLQHFELIIVDDHSTDGTKRVVDSFRDPRIQYVRNPERLGLTGNWNRCVEMAKGEFICLFHQDDVMLPENLERKVRLLAEDEKIGMVYSDVEIVGPRREIRQLHWFNKTDLARDSVLPGAEFFRMLILGENLVCCPSTVVRRKCYEQLGGFDATLPYTTDWEMWLRIALFFDIGFLASPLVLYRVHESNETFHFKGPLEIEHYYQAKMLALGKYPERVPNLAELQTSIARGIEKEVWNQLRSPLRELTAEEQARLMALAMETRARQSGTPGFADIAEWALRHADAGAVGRPAPAMEYSPQELPDSVRAWISAAKESWTAESSTASTDSLLRALEAAKQTGNPRLVMDTALAAGELLLDHKRAEFSAMMLDVGLRIADRLGDSSAAQRMESLLQGIEHKKNPVAPPAPATEEKKAAALPSPQRAAETVRLMLESDDLTQALSRHADRLDSEVLALIQRDAKQARAEGNASLADGLLEVAKQIEQALSRQPAAQSYNAHPSARVDIVIPIYGQAGLVRRCVSSVLATTADAQLILVDDDSPGEEISALFRNWKTNPRIVLAKATSNKGFLESSRYGASLGQAPFILFLNSDTEVTEPGWLEKMIPAEDDVAIVGARLVYPSDIAGPLAGTIQHAGIARTQKGVPYHPYLGLPADAPGAVQAHDVNAVTGACFLVRRSVWEALGGWDKRYGKGVYEDVDLCWQARSKGHRVFYQAAVMLIHKESASKNQDGVHALNEHTQENLQMLLEKWRSPKSDEALFYGEKTIRRWDRAQKLIQQARASLQQKKIKPALAFLKEAVALAEDLPEALMAYAQLLAEQGDHAQAAECMEKILRLTPASWPTRLRLVDEWTLAKQPERAAKELVALHAVFPEAPEIRQRAHPLAQFMEAARKEALAAKPLSGKAAAESADSTSVATLEFLLAQSDLPAALIANQHRLNADVLALVRLNANTARQDGDRDLAEGLSDLAGIISQMIGVE